MDIEIQQDLTPEDLERIRRSGIVGIDTETTGLQPRRDFLALVQLCDGEGNINVIRRRDWMNAHNFRAMLSDDAIEKVCHYAPFEGLFFLSHLQVSVKNFYCTRITSKLVRTYGANHDYDDMVFELLGIQIEEESVGLSDWYTTPELTQKQLAYAVKDAVYLIPMRNKLNEMLVEKGTLPSGSINFVELHRQCMAFIPTLVQLQLNGWDLGQDLTTSVFYYY